MATPSSGQICWSQIQAETGGSYCMSNFNSVSGRGYCASQYYNYSPTPPCYQFQMYASGFAAFLGCDGVYYEDFWPIYDSFCARILYSGAANNIGGCEF